MDFKGVYTIPAPPEATWVALHDPDILKACIPGAENVARVSETGYTARATIKMGPVKARFDGKVEWETAPSSGDYAYAGTLKGEGQGGAAGFARGETFVRLVADGDNTVLSYDAKATIGGKLAQVGQRLIDSVAKSMADEFFAKFANLMNAGRADAENQPPVAPHAHVEDADTGETREIKEDDGLAPQIWVVGLIAIVVILLVLFGIVL